MDDEEEEEEFPPFGDSQSDYDTVSSRHAQNVRLHVKPVIHDMRSLD